MTLAAAVAVTSVFAAGPSSAPATGSYALQVQDYITLTPSGDYGTVQTMDFDNPTEMSQGATTNPVMFEVSASRSWKATYTAGAWTRTGTPNPAVASEVPVSAISKIQVTGAHGGAQSDIPSLTAVATGANQLAHAANGGISQGFTLGGTVTPGFSYNMSGTYTSAVSVIATLD